MNKWVKYGLGAVVGLYVLGKLVGGGDDAPEAEAPASAPAAEAPADAPAEAAKEEAPAAEAGSKEAPVALGQTATGKTWAWTVNGMSDRGQTLDSDNQYIDSLTTTGRFVQVDFTVKNVGTDASFVEAPKIVDATGREFDYKSEGSSFLEEDKKCILEEINPGLDRPCSWIFELPSDADGLTIAVRDNMFGSAQFLATQ